MWAAVGWGGLAASSLLLGVLLALVRPWPNRLVGLVLAFGAGALIAAVSFELALTGLETGGPSGVAIGLAAGALTYYVVDTAVDRLKFPSPGGGPAEGGPVAGAGQVGPALALGAMIDGVPEQIILGIGLVSGPGVNLTLLVAVFVSNLPEAIGSVTDLRATGYTIGAIWRLWSAVTVVSVLAAVAGYFLAEVTADIWQGAIHGFAAGALLVMLIDSMIPGATARTGRPAGLLAVLGFAIAAGISILSD